MPRSPLRPGAGGVTPKPVDVTTHNGEPNGCREVPCGQARVVSHPNRLTSQHITVRRADAEKSPAARRGWCHTQIGLMPQHIALYRSAAEKRTIKRSDPTPRY